MKNLFKVLGFIALVALIGFSFTACGGGGDDGGGGGGGGGGGKGGGGTFTVTDIPSKYNGKYAFFVGAITTDYTLIGYQSLGKDDYILTLISGGSVSIPAWFVNKADKTSVRYSGNDTFPITFSIHDSSSYVDSDDLVTSTFASVKFSNGSATKSKNDASLWYE